MKGNLRLTIKGFLYLIHTLLFFGFINEGFGQSIWTNPITGVNPYTYAPYKDGEIVDFDITVSGIDRGPGITGNIANNRYNARGWTSTTLDPTDYFSFILTPNLGYQINLTNFNYTGQVSATGPINFAFRSSLDNFSTDIGAPTATSYPGTNITIDLTNPIYQNISIPIEFRIYAWGASSGLGTFSINDFTFNGTISKSTIDFDGVDDYVDFGDKHSLTSSFSLEAWVLQKAVVSLATIISKGDVKTANKRGYHLALNNGKPNLTWYNNSGVALINLESPYALTIDKWFHIAATYDGSTAKLFIDGLEVASATPLGSPINGTEKFLLGAVYNSGTPTVPKNYFYGYIDEVRVWNMALTAQQIREMMNQEIQNNGTAVKGKTIPLNISNGLLWENLVGYYPMNDDTANDESGNVIKIIGSPKNTTSSQPKTAPLPYISAADGAWDNAVTWLNGGVLQLPNALGIDGSTPIDWNIVETKNEITSGNRNITLLGMVSQSGKLTMDGTTNISTGTGTGQSFRITRYLELNGIIDLQGESQLVQDQGSILESSSTGYITINQQGTASSYNYNYWTSCVGPINQANNARFTIGDYLNNTGVLFDGTTLGTPKNITFKPAYAAADALVTTNPITVSSYWLYTFNGGDNDYNAWNKINEKTLIKPGEGYTIKGTSGAAAITDNQNYVFKGKPYNGDITLPIAKGGNRLIGNPYPSAIDANKFIDDNISVAEGGINTNGNVFNGALYFWDHFAGKTHYLKEYVGGYATYTKMGGAKAYSNDARINNNGTFGNKIPGRYIAVNQGFFVIATNDTLTNSIKSPTVIDGRNIVFKNSQRVFIKESSGNSVFMKGVNAKNVKDQNENNAITDKRSKIWLQFHSPAGYYRQLLVGADENASNYFDLGYDAPMADTGKEDMFWLIQEGKFVIQAVNNFDTDQELPLGLIVSKTGLARIKIDKIENIDENVSLHIKDKLTGKVHNISQKPFEINLAPGTYLDRFALIFKTQKLVDEDVVAEVLIPTASTPIEGIIVFMNNAISELQIKNNSNSEITSIVLYNSLGQTVKTWNTNLTARTISLPISTATGVYIVQINTKTGQTVKKISVV